MSANGQAGTAARGDARLRLGTCPDSWGVWFADDPLQTPWHRFLDEVAEVGYEWLELGPYGYLPSDPARLSRRAQPARPEGGRRHRARLQRAAPARRLAGHRPDHPAGRALTAAVGGRHLVFVPVPGYRDDKTGAYLEPAELDDEQWRTMIRATDELGKLVSEEYGLRLQFHPHADSHVETQEQTERFLDDTNPDYVSLCLDTGHLAYRHADNVAIISAATPTGSATCTSSRWTRPSWTRPTARAWRSARPWPWAPAASRPRASPTSRR